MFAFYNGGHHILGPYGTAITVGLSLLSIVAVGLVINGNYQDRAAFQKVTARKGMDLEGDWHPPDDENAIAGLSWIVLVMLLVGCVGYVCGLLTGWSFVW